MRIVADIDNNNLASTSGTCAQCHPSVSGHHVSTTLTCELWQILVTTTWHQQVAPNAQCHRPVSRHHVSNTLTCELWQMLIPTTWHRQTAPSAQCHQSVPRHHVRTILTCELWQMLIRATHRPPTSQWALDHPHHNQTRRYLAIMLDTN